MSDGISGIGAASQRASSTLADRLTAMRDRAQDLSSGTIQGGDTFPRFEVDAGRTPAESPFGATLQRLLNETSASQERASDAVARFVRGEPVELHQVMAASEEAGIALEMLVELRNKLTDAYRTLINMQS